MMKDLGLKRRQLNRREKSKLLKIIIMKTSTTSLIQILKQVTKGKQESQLLILVHPRIQVRRTNSFGSSFKH
jgi:predicted rRNA methylase YqxC with S4 and FtsJ domains